MHVKEMEKWLKKNLGKVGVDLGADKICEATLNGENEMDVKETLNQIYGSSVPEINLFPRRAVPP